MTVCSGGEWFLSDERTENYYSTLQILSALRSILESSQLNWFGALSTLVISFIFGPRKSPVYTSWHQTKLPTNQ